MDFALDLLGEKNFRNGLHGGSLAVLQLRYRQRIVASSLALVELHQGRAQFNRGFEPIFDDLRQLVVAINDQPLCAYFECLPDGQHQEAALSALGTC